MKPQNDDGWKTSERTAGLVRSTASARAAAPVRSEGIALPVASVLPRDPMILLSFLNMKLRDQYPSLDVLCEDLSVEKEELTARLSAIDYEYDPVANQFR